MIDSRFYALIAHLWRGGRYSYLWTPDDGQGEKLTHWLTLPIADDFSVPKLFLGRDAYFAVNPAILRKSQHERAHNTDIVAVNGFYCEFDCKTPADKDKARKKIAAWKIPPSPLRTRRNASNQIDQPVSPIRNHNATTNKL